MVIIKEMSVIEKITNAAYCMQPIPSKIVSWAMENTIYKPGDLNMPTTNIATMLFGAVMPATAGEYIDKISTEKHEIPVLVSSLAVKQDDGSWNLYSDVVIIFELKFDKGKDGITRTVNMKMMTKSTDDIMTGLDLFDLFSAFDGRVM